MPWREYKFDGGVVRDRLAKGRLTRVFKVWDTTKEAVVSAPETILKDGTTGPGLPAYNTPHPTIPNLLLDNYGVEVDGAVLYASAFYSNDGSGTFRTPIKPSETTFSSWAISYVVRQIEIPYALRGRQLINTPSGGTVTAQPWTLSKWRIDHVFTQAVLRMGIANFDATSRRIVAAQVDSIHYLPDGPGTVSAWLFAGAEATQLESDPQGWSVEYTWLQDPGTVTISPIAGGSSIGLPPKLWAPLVGTGIPFYVRPPYYSIRYIPDINPETLGKWEPVLTKEVNPDGWRTLPGLT